MSTKASQTSAAQTAIVLVLATFVLAILAYVGSFAFLVADGNLEWGIVIDRLDQETLRRLEVFYYPLILIVEAVID